MINIILLNKKSPKIKILSVLPPARGAKHLNKIFRYSGERKHRIDTSHALQQ
jgi:hypothetical protein